jgi:hypothetical protein
LPKGRDFVARDARARAAAAGDGTEALLCSGPAEEPARWLDEPRLRCEASAAPAVQRELAALAGADAQGSGFIVAFTRARLSAAVVLLSAAPRCCKGAAMGCGCCGGGGSAWPAAGGNTRALLPMKYPETGGASRPDRWDGAGRMSAAAAAKLLDKRIWLRALRIYRPLRNTVVVFVDRVGRTHTPRGCGAGPTSPGSLLPRIVCRAVVRSIVQMTYSLRPHGQRSAFRVCGWSVGLWRVRSECTLAERPYDIPYGAA